MNRRRLHELLDAMLDELQREEPSAEQPRRRQPRRPVRVDDISRAKARRALRRLGEPL